MTCICTHFEIVWDLKSSRGFAFVVMVTPPPLVVVSDWIDKELCVATTVATFCKRVNAPCLIPSHDCPRHTNPTSTLSVLKVSQQHLPNPNSAPDPFGHGVFLCHAVSSCFVMYQAFVATSVATFMVKCCHI